MITIVQKENDILRKRAEPVPVSEIGNERIRRILSDMKVALEAEEDGVAIAAPQIGVSLRIFLVSHKIHTLEDPEPAREGRIDADENKNSTREMRDLVFINPEIIKRSHKKHSVPEGCLSVRWLYGDVLRAEKATVRAYDESGRRFTRGASGILAQVFQHEIDHLDGILFTDKAKNIEEIMPDKNSTAPKKTAAAKP